MSKLTKLGGLSKRRLSPALFALILVAFLLPFATVSCGGETTFTGAELATWTVPKGGPVGESECDADIADCVEGRGSLPADIVLVAALCGLVLGLSRVRRGEGWCVAVGLVATLWIGAQALVPLGPDVTFHSGYWLILGAFLWLAALHVTRRLRRADRVRVSWGSRLGRPR